MRKSYRSGSTHLCTLLAFTLTLPCQAATLIGLSPNLPGGGTLSDLEKIMIEERSEGVGLMYASAKWCDLEPRAGQYNLKTLDGFPHLSSLGFKIAFTIQTIDTNNKTLPADLIMLPFDSPRVRERFDGLLRAISTRLSPDVRWVMLGNEVDVYLSQHSNELDAYTKFVESGRNTLRSLIPAQAVGVTVTHDGARDRLDMVQRLNHNMDVVSMTYYPLDKGFRVRPVSELPGDFARMVSAAGTKPLFLQEFGCPADPSISSEELQASYVVALFQQLSKYRDKVVAANWFLLSDFDDKFVDKCLQYYRVPQPDFRAYLSSLGLKHANGRVRKSWDVFRKNTRIWARTNGH